MNALDTRLHAYRADLADARLRGRVAAGRFVEGRAMQVANPVISVRSAPRLDARQVTEALMGERLRVFDTAEGWAFVQLETDGYVGYVSADTLSPPVEEPTNRISVPSTFIYSAPDIKSQPVITVTMNAAVTVTGSDDRFARLSNGRFVLARHLRPVAERESDFAAVAELFRHAPYYWGGKSVHGIDCSGLVQVSLQACGVMAPRDTDMQERSLGTKLLVNDLDGLRRGDLVFWNGHVGIMTDASTLLHANGHHMMTVSERLSEAVERIAAAGNRVTSVRRL